MSRPLPDLAVLIADPARAAEVPPDAIASVLTELGMQEARLATVKAILAARLASTTPTREVTDDADMLDDIEEVARLVKHSVSWVRKNGHRLPGFAQPGGKGSKVTWSRARLEVWRTQVS